MQINLSLCRTSDLLAVSSAIVMALINMYHLHMCKIVNKCKQIMLAEKMWWKSHCVYPEIIQSSLMGRLQEKSLEYNNCLYIASMSKQRVRDP